MPIRSNIGKKLNQDFINEENEFRDLFSKLIDLHPLLLELTKKLERLLAKKWTVSKKLCNEINVGKPTFCQLQIPDRGGRFLLEKAPPH